jgi:hypothetical protein
VIKRKEKKRKKEKAREGRRRQSSVGVAATEKHEICVIRKRKSAQAIAHKN